MTPLWLVRGPVNETPPVGILAAHGDAPPVVRPIHRGISVGHSLRVDSVV